METTDYCSYELSKALKAAGFNEPCCKRVKIIPGTKREEWDEEECQWCTVQDVEYYPKISLWQAQKWLRERAFEVVVTPIFSHGDRDGYDWDVYDDFSGHSAIHGTLPFAETYEQSLSAGIAAALELINK